MRKSAIVLPTPTPKEDTRTMTKTTTRGEGRHWKRTNGSWAIAYFVNGNEVRESVAKALRKAARTVTEGDALRLLRTRLGQLESDTYLAPSADRATVGALIEEYLADLWTRKEARRPGHGDRAVRQWDGARAHLTPLLDRRASALTTHEVTGWTRDRLRAGGAPGTVNHDIALLSAAYRHAWKSGRIARRPHLPRLEVHNARQGFFERDELEPIVDAISCEVARALVLAADHLGCRVGELLALQWPAVNRRARTVRFLDTKNGDTREVPIEGALVELIERCWQARVVTDTRGTEHLIPYVFHRRGRALTDGALRYAWNRACRRAGFWLQGRPTKLLHDLRRTYARDARNAGVDETVIMKQAGWRSRSPFLRYAIVSQTDLRAAQAKLAEHRSAAVAALGGSPPPTRTKTRTVADGGRRNRSGNNRNAESHGL
jgi:integrase